MKIAVLQGHTSRVLFMGMSPDGANVVTGAGDESLRFWKVFPESKNDAKKTYQSKNIFDDVELSLKLSSSQLR